MERVVVVVGVAGNPRPGSRTLNVVERTGGAVATALNGQFDGAIDLISLKNEIFDFGAPGVARALEAMMRADVLVIGSPVFKASYTGVLKAFCDHIAAGQLAGKV